MHRIGRTGRANAVGDAISFVSSDEQDDLRLLERFIGRGIVRKRAEGFDYSAAAAPLSDPRRESGGGGGGGQGRGRNGDSGRPARPPQRGGGGASGGASRGGSFRPRRHQ